MTVTESQVIRYQVPTKAITETIASALSIISSIQDRKDLHERDFVERFQDILMGEIAELMVIGWLKENGKFAESAVDKTSMQPDAGHDIWLIDNKGKRLKASVKSSLSALKSSIPDILSVFTLATTKNEVRDINIHVMFWLSLYTNPRVSVPTVKNSAIMAWASRKDLEAIGFQPYNNELRLSPTKKLKDLRPLPSLLEYLG